MPRLFSALQFQAFLSGAAAHNVGGCVIVRISSYVARSARTLIISETPKRTTPSNAGFVCRENNLSIERSSQFVDARVQYQIEPSTGRIEATYEK